MKSEIAWTRLIFYVGASILLLTEFYRLSLTLLRIIVVAPSLMSLLQTGVHWGLLLGFSCLSLSLYLLTSASPPIITLEKYSQSYLGLWARISVFLSITLIIGMLLPPIGLISADFKPLFSTIYSLSWLIFYSLLVTWIIIYWKISLNEKETKFIVRNVKIAIHIGLGICIVIYWFLETFSLIVGQEALSNNESINLIYIIFLVLFLFNQVLLNYRITKFSYKIYG